MIASIVDFGDAELNDREMIIDVRCPLLVSRGLL